MAEDDDSPPQLPAPREFWLPRTDAGARKLIERIDIVRAEIEDVHKALEKYVTHKHLLGIAAGFAVAVISAAWMITKAESASAKAAAVEVRSDLKEHIAEEKQANKELQVSMERRTKAIYEHARTKRRQSLLEQPIDGGDE